MELISSGLSRDLENQEGSSKRLYVPTGQEFAAFGIFWVCFRQ